MEIAWADFTPWHALLGGVLIGLASSVLMLANGQIAGVSGILVNLVRKGGALSWRIAFVLGLLLSPVLFGTVLPQISPAPLQAVEFSLPLVFTLLGGGLLVGIGTRLANGCTSGHGVCGLARLSPRSLVAVLTFMAAGFATVFVLRHLLGVSA